ncbi:unnamed protein product, partial [Didymodactylos carnosus]
MSDIEGTRQSLKKKRILFCGDSIARGMYKDLCLLSEVDNDNNRLLTHSELKYDGDVKIFNDIVHLFKKDRRNSYDNIERREYKNIRTTIFHY